MATIPKTAIFAAAIGCLALAVAPRSAYAQEDAASARPMTAEEMLRRRAEHVEEFLRKLDANGNGVIDADELDGPQKGLLERMIGAKPGELKCSLDIKQIVDTHMKNYRAMVMPKGAGGGEAGNSPAKAAAPPVAAQPAATNAQSPKSDSQPVTFRAAPAADSGPAAANGAKSRSASLRKGIRFLTPSERLPKGLPDWFKAKDLNGDGQISMGEFASEWTPEKEAEFLRYDLNRDGYITPDECLKVEKAAKGRP